MSLTKARQPKLTRQQSGYGADWQRLRAVILLRDPRCQYDGCIKQSTDVDHIIARRNGGTESPTNLRGLCHAHHSKKTVREDGGLDGGWPRRRAARRFQV